MAKVSYNNGELEGAIDEKAANTIVVNGDGNNVTVKGGSAADNVTVKKDAKNYSIDVGAGNDVITTENETEINNIDAGDGDNKITNNGGVDGNIVAGAGKDTITINGKVLGYVDAGAGNNNIKIEGAAANIITGSGNDIITVSATGSVGSEVEGIIAAGDGNNTITINGSGADIKVGSGNDKITVAGSKDSAGKVTEAGTGYIELGTGNDTVTLTYADVDDIVVAKDNYDNKQNYGDNKITANYSVIGDIKLGSGKNTIALTNTNADSIVTGSGNDTVTIGGKGNVKPYSVIGDLNKDAETAIDLGAGSNNLTITGSDIRGVIKAVSENAADKNIIKLVGGNVGGTTQGLKVIQTGAGADTLSIEGGGTSGNIDLGAGANTVTLTKNALVGVIYAGTADDKSKNTVKLDSSSAYGIITGAGDDSVTLAKGSQVRGDIDAGAGNNIIAIDGTVDGKVITGAGSDKITVNKESVVLTSIDAGAGDDTIVINGSVEYFGAGGTISTGAGSDKLTVDFKKLANNTTIDVSGNVEGDVDVITINNLKFADAVVDGTEDAVTISQGDKKITLVGMDYEDKKSTVKFQDGAKTFNYLIGLIKGELNGTDGADKLLVNKGGLTVNAGKGNDTVTVGAVEGTNVYLEAGNNTVSLTNDVATQINGGAGNETIKATGSQNLSYVVGEGVEKAGKDNITLTNVTGAEIATGAGADTITLTNVTGAKIAAGAGNDIIKLTNVQGEVDGGAGNDTITVVSSDNEAFVVKTGAGSDKLTVDFKKLANNTTIDVSGNAEGDVDVITINNLKFADAVVDGIEDAVTISQGDKTITLVGMEYEDKKSTVKFQDGAKTFNYLIGLIKGELNGTDGADKLLVNKGGLTVNAGKGNDTVTVGAVEGTNVYLEAGNNTVSLTNDVATQINGGAGNETIKATGSQNLSYVVGEGVVKAGKDNITLTNVAGANIVTGVGADTITLSNVTDTNIAAGAGNDIIKLTNVQGEVDGGAGNDTITVVSSNNENFVVKTGAGSDKLTLDFNKLTNNTTINVSGNEANDVDVITISNLNFADAVVGGTEGAVTVTKGGKTITLVGMDYADKKSTVKFKDGAKTFNYLVGLIRGELNGTDGADKLLVNKGELAVNAGKGNDTVTVGAVEGTTVILEAGNNTVTLTKDVATKIKGGTGNETIKAIGSQNLSYVVGEGVVKSGKDNITLTNVIGADIVTGVGADTITLSNVTDANISTGAGIDIITINAGKDLVIDAGAGADKITIDFAKVSGNTVVDLGVGEKDTLTLKNVKSTDFTDIDIVDGSLMLTKGYDTLIINNWESSQIDGITLGDGKKSRNYFDTSVSLKSGIAYGTSGADKIVIDAGKYSVGKDSFSLNGQTETEDGYKLEVYSGAGADNITVNEGENIYVNAGEGVDTINVTKGNDYWVHAGDGNDKITISGGEGHFVVADNGDDTITVSGGYDIGAFGEVGNDIINITGGDEIYTYGEDGDDTITVSADVKDGSYSMNGGSGSDTYRITRFASGGSYYIFNKDGGNNDKLDLKNFKSTEFDVYSIGESVYLLHKKSQARIVLCDMATDALSIAFKDKIATATQVKTVLSGVDLFPATSDKPSGSSGVNTYEGTDASDMLSGIYGNKLYLDKDAGSGVRSTISSGNPIKINLKGGDDLVMLTDASKLRIYGDSGNDMFTLITGTNSYNYINGGSGSDTINSTGKNSVYKGGADRDTIIVGSTNSVLSLNSYINGDEGNDDILIDSSSNVVAGGAGNDTITIGDAYGSDSSNNRVYGGEDNDTIKLEAGAWHTYVDGGAGNDIIMVESSFNTIKGGTGADEYDIMDTSMCYIVVEDNQDTLNIVSAKGGANISDYESYYDSQRDIMDILTDYGSIGIAGFSKLNKIYIGSSDLYRLGNKSYTAEGFIAEAKNTNSFTLTPISDAILELLKETEAVDISSLANDLDKNTFPGIKDEILKITGSN